MFPDLEGADATQILTWAFDHFGDRIALSTAFGPSGVVLLHLASEIRPGASAFFLDTGYHFPETLAMVDRTRQRLGSKIRLDVVSPDALAVTTDQLGPIGTSPLYAVDPDRCCGLRKVDPTRKVLRGLDAWITALRRDQGPSRAQTPVLEEKLSDGRTLLKVNPLATWTRKEIWRHIVAHDLPYNPLHDQGYASVGCWPCTQPSSEEGDERAGRWAGQDKSECGLHTQI